MNIRQAIAVVVFAASLTGCTSLPYQVYSRLPRAVYPPGGQQRLSPPATPLHGQTVGEADLPTELSTWREAKPTVPGGISRAVDGSLYVFASSGGVHDDAQQFTIGDVRVLDDRVEVDAYLVQTKAVVSQGRYYPKDYVKLDYAGPAEELPVELKIHYDSAAYAYVKGPFDVVDPAYLPTTLQEWLTPSGETVGKAARFGSYLYLMAAAGPSLDAGEYFNWAGVQLRGDVVAVTANVVPRPTGAPPDYYAASTLLARIPYQLDEIPEVDLEIREVVPTDLSQVDRVVVQQVLSGKQEELTGEAVTELIAGIESEPLIPLTWSTPTVKPNLRIQFLSGSSIVAEADAATVWQSRVMIEGENAVRYLGDAPSQLLRSIWERLK